MLEDREYGLLNPQGKETAGIKTRALVTLEGKAAQLWQRLPKGSRSNIVSNLLLEAYYLGKLDLFLNPEEENKNKGKNQNKIKKRVKGQAGIKVSVAEKPKDSTGQRAVVAELVPSEKANVSNSNKRPGWLIDLEKKINSFVRLDG